MSLDCACVASNNLLLQNTSLGGHQHSLILFFVHAPTRIRVWLSVIAAMLVITEVVGAQRVVRESAAQWRAAHALSVTPTQRWCANPEAAGCELRAMANVIGLPDGGIVVSDIAGPIHRFRATGEFVGSLARRGRGPGEYGMVLALQLMPSGQLAWFDNSQMRVATIGLDGKAGPVTPLMPPHTMTSVYIVGGGLVVLDVPASPTVGDTVVGVYRTVPSSGAPRVLGQVRTPSIFTLGSDMFTPPPPFAPSVVASVGWGGDVAHSNGGTYTVEVLPSVGVPWTLKVALPIRAVSAAEHDSMVAAMLARSKVASVAALPPYQRTRLDRAGRTMPPLRAIRVLRDGMIWIAPTPDVGARTGRWDVFRRDGQRIGAVQLPLSAMVVDGTREWILAVERGRDDVPIAVRYTVGK